MNDRTYDDVECKQFIWIFPSYLQNYLYQHYLAQWSSMDEMIAKRAIPFHLHTNTLINLQILQFLHVHKANGNTSFNTEEYTWIEQA